MKEEYYYIPFIEEFYIGFEYEYYVMNVWQQVAFHPSDFAYTETWLENLDKKLLRVKYLDKEDIESLGFNTTAEYDRYIEFTDGNKKFLYRMEYKTMYIEDQPSPNTTRTLFYGIIKNKSELKQLLKQLQIN